MRRSHWPSMIQPPWARLRNARHAAVIGTPAGFHPGGSLDGGRIADGRAVPDIARKLVQETSMPLKVGIVGMHGIGVPHANAHAQDPLAEFVAVCDAVRERAERAAEKYGVRAYTSLREMLANEPDLDIVDVCTGGYENGSWHFEPAMEA